MRASFDDSGNLILSPETTLERMAAKAFVQSMRTRNKPEILIAGNEAQAKSSVSLIAQEAEYPSRHEVMAEITGQTKIDDVIKAVGGI